MRRLGLLLFSISATLVVAVVVFWITYFLNDWKTYG